MASPVPSLKEQMQMLGVDRPSDRDVPHVYELYPALECITGDGMHIVYDISACFGGSAEPAVVSDMKVCMLKWFVAGTCRWLSGGYFKTSEREVVACT